MKKVLAGALALFLLLPLTVLYPSAAVYSGKALDVEYIINNQQSGVEYPDTEMTDEELAEWEREHASDSGKKEDEADGDEITDDEALYLAPNYHIQYEADTAAKTLRIFCGSQAKGGQQEMLSYAKAAWIPWIRKAEIRNCIETAVIEEGVLSVGHYVFYQCKNLKTVYLPQSITKVDFGVFYLCENLETIYYAGTKEDFESNVQWINAINMLDKAGTVNAIDKIHFGEHVVVKCQTQEGHVFAEYTVGGYNAGDEYKISPKSFTGMTLAEGGEQTGSFKRNDSTVYTFTYRCAHEYQTEDPDKPCASYCIYCGAGDPNGVPHTYREEVISKRGFTSAGEVRYTCSVCGHTEVHTEFAYYWYALVLAGAAAVVGLISFAIAYPLHKRKKLKNLTW